MGQASFFKVALVMLLGPVERRRGCNLGNDGTAISSGSIHRSFGLGGSRFLFGAVEEDDRPILRSHVGALAVQCRRIVRLPKRIEQLFVADSIRVELDFHDFGMARSIGADVL